nr:hypothetical protein CFP56_15847 [Quercus suber]
MLVPNSTTGRGADCLSKNFSTSQSAPRPRQHRKRKRVVDNLITESGIPPTDQPPTTVSHVASTSLTSTSGWECNFQLGDKVLPIDSYIWTWRNGLRGQVSDSLGKALLLLADLNHYTDCQDKDIVPKLKWHTIAIDDQFEDAEKEKGEDELGMRELSQQINAHMVVIDEENPTIATPIETQSAPQSTSSLVPPTAQKAPLTTFAVP